MRQTLLSLAALMFALGFVFSELWVAAAVLGAWRSSPGRACCSGSDGAPCGPALLQRPRSRGREPLSACREESPRPSSAARAAGRRTAEDSVCLKCSRGL